MRGFVAIIALIVSIGGLLLVIAYGASDAYLNFQADEDNLNDSLLLTSLAPSGWESAPVSGVNFREAFIAPCLQTPLLNGTSTDGRGAIGYVPPGGVAPGAQMLIVQTSAGSAQAIMDDVGRDTENGCQRGITVGTVDQASVSNGSVESANRSVLVEYQRQVGEAVRSHQVLILQQENFVAHISYETTDNPAFDASDLMQLGGALAARIDSPPTVAQLEAAGAIDEPTTVEEWATRINDRATRTLTLNDRIPVAAGLAGLGGVIVMLYVLGARLSRTPDPVADSPAMVPGYGMSTPTPTPLRTVDDYGAPERRWIQNSNAPRRRPQEEYSVEFKLDADEPEEELNEEEPAPSGPPPVIDFPQKSIEEKLKILKDARLKEPKREHRAMREITPDVDWTEEISKADEHQRDPAQPTAQPASRKAVMRKLRANSESD